MRIQTLIRFFLLSTVLLLCTASGYSQAANDNYVLLPDGSGYDRTAYEPELELAATQLVDMLKAADQLNGTTYGDHFKVYDYGYYLHNETMSDGHSKARSAALSGVTSTYYLMILKKTTSEGLYNDIELAVNLPNISNTCHTPSDIETMLDYSLNGYRSAPNPLRIEEPLTSLLGELEEVLEKVIYCCADTTSGQVLRREKSNTSNLCSTACDNSFARNVEAHLSSRQYASYKHLGRIDSASIMVSNPDLGITEDIIDLGQTFVADLQQNFPNKDISFNVFHIDLSSSGVCDVAYDNFTLLKNNEISISSTNYFQENVVVFTDRDGSVSVYYKFEFNDAISSAICVANNPNKRPDEKAFILPALAIRYILKKAALGAASVVVDIGINVLINKVLGSYSSWSEAWDNTDIGGWNTFYSFIEGVVGEKVEDAVGIGIACIEGPIDYLNNINACGFEVAVFFERMIRGCEIGLRFALLGDYLGDFMTGARRHLGDEGAEALKIDVEGGNSKLLEDLITGKYSVKAWKGAIDFPNVRKDVKFLESFSKALDDATLKGAPINIETRFKDWITNSHLKCRTCATGSEPFLDEVLDNLFEFKSFLSKPGATKVIDDIGKSTRGAEGANWVMKFTKDKGLNPSAFEEIITDGRKFTADIVEGSGSTVKYFECKSWDSSMKGLFTGGNTNFGAQFTNYLHNTNISNLSQFGYHFNPAKWTPNAADLNSALKASSNLFDTNKWSKYQQLFQFTNAQVSPNDINGLIDFITSNKFNNIVNP